MAKLNQKTISEKSGYSKASVSMFVSTKKRPTWLGAKRLASAVPGTTPVLWLEGTKEQIKTAIKNASTMKEAS